MNKVFKICEFINEFEYKESQNYLLNTFKIAY